MRRLICNVIAPIRVIRGRVWWEMSRVTRGMKELRAPVFLWQGSFPLSSFGAGAVESGSAGLETPTADAE